MSWDGDVQCEVVDGNLAEFGRAAVYVTSTGVRTSLTVVAGAVKTDLIGDGERQTLRHTRPVTLSADPAGPHGGVADPAENATIEIDGAAWYVRGVQSGAGWHTLTCERRPLAARHRPGYRGGT